MKYSVLWVGLLMALSSHPAAVATDSPEPKAAEESPATASPESASPVDAPKGPCSSEAHRAFDFWIGDWQVYTPTGKLAGTNQITSRYGGCVLHEVYQTGGPYRGESFNVYDAGRGVWHQTWVDTSGTLLLLEGGRRGESMVLEGEITARDDGTVKRHRITWTPLGDGDVRQLWESTDAEGRWTVAFDGRYTPRPDS